MKVLVTGCAGFIGMHVCLRLLSDGVDVIGFDNINNYYDPSLKEARLSRLQNFANFTFYKVDIADFVSLNDCFKIAKPTYVVNLAAQAGVRYSLTNPNSYISANIQGFVNILECCRHGNIKHLIYASSSSVYGGNSCLPFNESQHADHPLSLYAATKKSNEMLAHTYSHLFAIPTTGLRFFTVYGPWGRPDMALFKFTKSIIAGEAIDVYNNGNMTRDFTYIDDVVEGIARVIYKPATASADFRSTKPDPAISFAPYRIFNIGNNNPVLLADYIQALENSLGIAAKKNFISMQPGDVLATGSDIAYLYDWIGFKPKTNVVDGVERFVGWYRDYYQC